MNRLCDPKLKMSSRLITALIIQQVVETNSTLSQLFSNGKIINPNHHEKALIQEMSYGTIRWYIQLEALLNQLLDKPIKTKNNDLKYLLLIGLYQLIHMDIAPHAVVSETVETCTALNKQWAKNLLNAVLRRHLRMTQASPATDSDIILSHPHWLIERLQKDYPRHWQTIIQANNQRPPMYLRVNQRHQSRNHYLTKLKQAGIDASATRLSAQGILLEKPIAVQQLPGFSDGEVSVQDLAAQLCVQLLDLNDQQRVLDACAAPGGKTAHILESNPTLQSVIAIEPDPKRARKLTDTLNRLQLNATIKIADALDINAWWDRKPFDRILLDTPCSATGVIRRHPDIKLRCSTNRVNTINQLQQQLLNTLWPLLKRKGLLLYATCSVLNQENSELIKHFLETHHDAVSKPIVATWGLATDYGRQILPGDNNMDGFFYACLEKK